MALIHRIVLDDTFGGEGEGGDRITLRVGRTQIPMTISMVVPCEYLELSTEDALRLRDALSDCLSEVLKALVKEVRDASRKG